MTQPNFFQYPITRQFVQELGDIHACQLIDILKSNFLNQFHSYSILEQNKNILQQQIQTGQKNIKKLQQISTSHQKHKTKILTQLELIEAQCSALKEQLKHASSP